MKTILTILLMIPAMAYASEWSSPARVVDIVGGYKAGFFLFKTSGSHHNPHGECQPEYYSVDPESANVDQAFAMVLAAQRSEAEVEVGVDPTGCGRSGVLHLTGKIKVTRIRAK